MERKKRIYLIDADEPELDIDNFNKFNLFPDKINTREILSLFTDPEFDNIFIESKTEIENYIEELIADKLYQFSNQVIKNEYLLPVAQKIYSVITNKYIPAKFIVNIIAKAIDSNIFITEIEVLNEIYTWNDILNTLNIFKAYSIKDLILRNLKVENHQDDKLNHIANEYKTIKNLDQISIFSEIKDRLSQNFKRTCDKDSYYRYINLACNNYCEKNYNNFIKIFIEYQPAIYEYYLENNLLDQIQSIFIKYCIFSHNSAEIAYHPFNFNRKYCNNEIVCKDLQKFCVDAHFCNYTELFMNFNYNKNKTILNDLKQILDEKIKKLSNLGKIAEIKTKRCERLLCSDYTNCFDHHNILERRRTNYYNISQNRPCAKVYIDGKWQSPDLCKLKDNCKFFHTRNELLYDFRNFRKIYECNLDKNHTEAYCAYKHPSNIIIEETNISENEKAELKKLQQEIEIINSKIANLRKK